MEKSDTLCCFLLNNTKYVVSTGDKWAGAFFPRELALQLNG